MRLARTPDPAWPRGDRLAAWCEPSSTRLLPSSFVRSRFHGDFASRASPIDFVLLTLCAFQASAVACRRGDWVRVRQCCSCTDSRTTTRSGHRWSTSSTIRVGRSSRSTRRRMAHRTVIGVWAGRQQTESMRSRRPSGQSTPLSRTPWDVPQCSEPSPRGFGLIEQCLLHPHRSSLPAKRGNSAIGGKGTGNASEHRTRSCNPPVKPTKRPTTRPAIDLTPAPFSTRWMRTSSSSTPPTTSACLIPPRRRSSENCRAPSW